MRCCGKWAQRSKIYIWVILLSSLLGFLWHSSGQFIRRACGFEVDQGEHPWMEELHHRVSGRRRSQEVWRRPVYCLFSVCRGWSLSSVSPFTGWPPLQTGSMLTLPSFTKNGRRPTRWTAWFWWETSKTGWPYWWMIWLTPAAPSATLLISKKLKKIFMKCVICTADSVWNGVSASAAISVCVCSG